MKRETALNFFAFSMFASILVLAALLWLPMKRVDAQEASPESVSLAALASADAKERDKAIAALAAAGDAALPALLENMEARKPGFAQTVAVLAAINTEESWKRVGDILKTKTEPRDMELRRRALIAVGEFFRIEYLPVIEAMPEAIPWDLFRARSSALQRFEAVPKDAAVRARWSDAQVKGSQDYLGTFWIATETGGKADKKDPQLFRLQFVNHVVDPRLVQMAVIPGGAIKAHTVRNKTANGAVSEFTGFLFAAPPELKASRDEFTDADLSRHYYEGSLRDYRKNTPGSWMWVQFQKRQGDKKSVEVWMDPAMLSANLPFAMPTFAEDNEARATEAVAVAPPKARNAEESFVPLPATGKDLKGKLSSISWGLMQILVVPGEFDHVERVFEDLDAPYVMLEYNSFQELLSGRPGKGKFSGRAVSINRLDPARHVLALNCTFGELQPVHAATLRRFVGSGGYVLATDWAQSQLVAAFPDYIEKTEDDLSGVHVVSIAKDVRRHELLADFKNVDATFNWWFDGGSWGIKALRPDAYVLAVCPELNDIPVAVTWTYETVVSGDPSYPGRVLYFVSHLEQQEKQAEGDHNLQMCLVNFLQYKEYEIKRAGEK